MLVYQRVCFGILGHAFMCQAHILTWRSYGTARKSSFFCMNMLSSASNVRQARRSVPSGWNTLEKKMEKWENCTNFGRKQNCPCSVSKPNYLSNSKAQISSSEMPPEKHVLLAIVESGYQETKHSRSFKTYSETYKYSLQMSTVIYSVQEWLSLTFPLDLAYLALKSFRALVIKVRFCAAWVLSFTASGMPWTESSGESSFVMWVCLKIVYPYTQWLMIIIIHYPY